MLGLGGPCPPSQTSGTVLYMASTMIFAKSQPDLFEGGPRLLQSPLIRHALGL